MATECSLHFVATQRNKGVSEPLALLEMTCPFSLCSPVCLPAPRTPHLSSVRFWRRCQMKDE